MEKMVVINSGDGSGGGASRITGDLTNIIAQLPPLLESLTGVKFDQLLKQIPALRNAIGNGQQLPTETVVPPPPPDGDSKLKALRK
jgi:flotillin